jgi:hypothetical protein
LATAREEETQVVVDFCRGGNCGARIARGIFLANGDGGRYARDLVYLRLFHALEELAGVRRQRFDVAALPFGVNGVESERRFAGATDSRDDGDGVVGNFDSDVAQIVNAGAADADDLLFAEHGREFFGGQGEAQTVRSERPV